ncbi:hypothetical protein [Solirubrobacter soli]|uniref:hypothetical protein n=1 Tax=Solirubrobacter soli TaxID=363832 RepID=UPI000426B8D5|nr:hypothetical protein [Solirubrobacter soli]
MVLRDRHLWHRRVVDRREILKAAPAHLRDRRPRHRRLGYAAEFFGLPRDRTVIVGSHIDV